MASLTDTDFVPRRLGKVVAVGAEDGPSFCVVLEGAADDTRLPIWIGTRKGSTCPPPLPECSSAGR